MRRSGLAVLLAALVLVAICASLALVPAGTPAQAAAERRGGVTYNFDKDKPGALPPGWTVAETNGKGKPAKWAVVKDASAASKPNVLEITQNRNSGGTFNLLINKAESYGNLDIEVMVKALRGSEDQGGGPIWRVKDANNYYLARWNPLETNFRIYYVKNGRRIQLGSAEVKADAAKWHRVSITQRGDRMTASFDGKQLLTAEDTNITGDGGIGLWSKADAATAFDDLKVEVRRGRGGEGRGEGRRGEGGRSRLRQACPPVVWRACPPAVWRIRHLPAPRQSSRSRPGGATEVC